MTSKHTSRYSSRDYFTLEFIPFVTPKQEPSIVKETSSGSVPIKNSFSGKEASDFYKNIISIPSSAKRRIPSSPPTKPERKAHTSVKSSFYSPNKLLKYAQDGNLEAVEYCLGNDKLNLVNQQDMYGWTPLMCATCEGHVKTVKYLLECGADLNVKNKQGMTALDIANEKEHFAIVDILKNGIHPVNVKAESLEEVQRKEEYCKDCKLFYKETKELHERSIAHLFSARKADLTTFYHIPENNKGFQMMVKSGWDQNKGLGSKEEGRKFPIKTILKKDRSCIGRSKEVARVTHFNANDCSAVKRVCDPSMKIVREKTLKKWQRAKLEKKNRQKEIEFRRQFICDF